MRSYFKILMFLLLISWQAFAQPGLRVRGGQYEQWQKPLPAFNIMHAENRDSTKNEIVKSPRGAMLRSIFIPGAGQLYNGKWLKAILVFGVEAGLVANGVYLNDKLRAAKEDYAREFYAEQKSVNNWRMLAFILLSSVDAYIDAHLADFDESPNLSLHILPTGPEKNGTMHKRLIGVSLQF